MYGFLGSTPTKPIIFLDVSSQNSKSETVRTPSDLAKFESPPPSPAFPVTDWLRALARRDALALALASGAGYLVVQLFEQGYLAFFGVPSYFAAFDTANADTLIATTISIFIALHWLRNDWIVFKHSGHKSVRSKLISLVVMCYFIYVYFGSLFIAESFMQRHYWDALAISQILILLIILRRAWKRPLSKDDAPISWSSLLRKSVSSEPFFWMATLALLVSVVPFGLGYAAASKRARLSLIADGSNRVIIRKYGDSFILKILDRNNHLTPGFQVVAKAAMEGKDIRDTPVSN